MRRARTTRLGLTLALAWVLIPTRPADASTPTTAAASPSTASSSASSSSASSSVSVSPQTLEALRATIQRLTAILGDGQAAARARACTTNIEGVCVYRSTRARSSERLELDAPPERAPRPESRALIDAYAAYLEHPGAAQAPDRAAARYHLAQLLIETGDDEAARPHLERLIAGDDPERAAWAALLLIDARVLELTASDATLEHSLAAGAAIRRELARLESLPLWRHEAAAPLRERAPTLVAGIRWREAMALLERGRSAGDPTGASRAFRECGAAFVSLHEDSASGHPMADTLLWSAASCFDAGGDAESALAQRLRLVERYPLSEHVERTTLYIAESLRALARFERAAAWYERYAARYPRHEEAADALRVAMWVRGELGQTRELRAALEMYERYYARRDPQRAAAAVWAAYPQLTDGPDAREAYLEGFLKRYGSRGGRGRTIIASAALARALWSKTCLLKQDVVDAGAGLCAAPQPGGSVALDDAGAGRARRHEARALDVRRRGGADLAGAIRLAQRVVVDAARGRVDVAPEDVAQQRALADAVTGAWLLLADARFEMLLEGAHEASREGAHERDDPRARPWFVPGYTLTGHRIATLERDASLATEAGLASALAEAVHELDRAYASIERDEHGTTATAIACVRRAQLREWLAERTLTREGACEGRGRDRRCASATPRFDALRGRARETYARCLGDARTRFASPEAAAVAAARLTALGGHHPAQLRELTGWTPAEDAAPSLERVGVITDYEAARGRWPPGWVPTRARER
ncbi:MAG: hypothetical protein H6713_03250 [Myxococcales bacterium]|nr:hypothetical protein [Myxococcales bacterium]